MCEPTTIMAGVAVVSAAFSAQQQVQQGKYQKGVAEYNAAVAENEAQDVREAGVEAENLQRRRTAELLSKQRAQLGAANIDLSSGSALQLQEDTELLGETEALRIRTNYQDQAEALEGSATLTSSEGAFAESAGKTGAVGTLLSGASTVLGTGVADKWFTSDSAALSATNMQGQSVTGTSYQPSF